jgi:hypothetical protein
VVTITRPKPKKAKQPKKGSVYRAKGVKKVKPTTIVKT